MSGSEKDQVKLIAERIARRLSENGAGKGAGPSAAEAGESGDVDQELAALRASLAEVRKRLAEVESQIKDEERGPTAPVTEASRAGRGASNQSRAAEAPSDRPLARSPWLSGVYVPATHPSNERFGIAEAAVSELVDFFEKEKTCTMEPGNKPCDHCAMCNTRGF